MTIYILQSTESGGDALIVAAYLREELALAARDKLGDRYHSVEEVEVFDA